MSQQIQDDALYVLGVAGLASKRLLSRHHIPESCVKTISSSTGDEGAIDVCAHSTTTAPSATTPASRKLRKICAHIAKVRQAVHAYQTRKLLVLSKVLLNAPAKMLKRLWIVGGGTRSLSIALTFASVLMIAVIRPLLVAFGKESLNVVGPS